MGSNRSIGRSFGLGVPPVGMSCRTRRWRSACSSEARLSLQMLMLEMDRAARLAYSPTCEDTFCLSVFTLRNP